MPAKSKSKAAPTGKLAKPKVQPKTKSGKKKNKKDSQLVIRIGAAERDSFVSLCDELDTSAAREIRKFMRDFVKKNR